MILCSSIILSPTNRIETVPISLVYIIWPIIVTKLIFLAFVFENSLQLLYGCWNVHKFKNYVSAMSNGRNFLAMQTFLPGLDVNGSTLSELLVFSMA